jgi:hypothetical protein
MAEYENRRNARGETEPTVPGWIPPPGLTDAQYADALEHYLQVQHQESAAQFHLPRRSYPRRAVRP